MWVFLGGGLGSICRYGISVLLKSYQFNFPLATFMANVISCIVLGVLVGFTLRQQLEQWQQLMFLTGFCGGFSTFSTFTLETLRLLQAGNAGLAFFYIASSILCCLVCIYLGIKVVA